MEDMEGYEKKNWEELKKEMLEKWGQSEQRYRESDLDRLAEEMAGKGGVVTREQYGKYVSSFDWILRYLNRNEIVTDTPGAVKRTFIKAFPKEMRERAARQLFERNLVKRSKDGGVIVLPDMKEIQKALLGEMDMREEELEDRERLGVRSR
jgi:vacuolar-type H+-ATPase subunit I/STV1